MPIQPLSDPEPILRREFLEQASVGGLAMAAATQGLAAPREAPSPSTSRTVRTGTNETKVALRVNGRRREITIEPRVTLLDALREYLGLSGSKKGCDHGQCGACTVLINGRRTY